ncbi:MAG: ABC transporter ATP-binding protein [Deferrisomatales bacterium]
MSAEAILRVEGLAHAYGRFQVLRDVSLTVPSGVLTALIGPNGAGKTTFYNIVSGRFRPSRGKVYFQGRDITGMPPHRIAPLGLARSFQITNVFPHLTVLDNVLVPLVLEARKTFALWRDLRRERALRERAEAVLDRVGLLPLAHRRARELAYGDKRLVEIALVLAREPKLVLLDEPTAGMTPEETERMAGLVRELADRFGTTFFLTEHDMQVVFALAARIHVLHQGVLLASGPPEAIRDDERVREAYLGKGRHA